MMQILLVIDYLLFNDFYEVKDIFIVQFFGIKYIGEQGLPYYFNVFKMVEANKMMSVVTFNVFIFWVKCIISLRSRRSMFLFVTIPSMWRLS